MTLQSRRDFLKQAGGLLAACASFLTPSCQQAIKKRPNILFAISDDQSWLHTSVQGCRAVSTPAFDRIANEGALFQNVFAAAPQCSPNRAAILTGRHIWQLEEAGTHASNFPAKFETFPDLLENGGYQIGFTGKGWGPGNWEVSGRKRNPAGIRCDHVQSAQHPRGINAVDYAGNFDWFIKHRETEKPFFFWYGGYEPHRSYEKGIGRDSGKNLNDIEVPGFLPDTAEVRSDIADYLTEIEWFDSHLTAMLKTLEAIGELDNTVVVVTSDNGMPFPRAKANLYEYGIHLPLAMRWPGSIEAGRIIEDLISFTDFAPTFLDMAGMGATAAMSGKSLLPLIKGHEQGPHAFVQSGRERHTHARPDNLGYPIRSIRTDKYLYIINLKPERWPAGNPAGSGDADGYHDIDGSPTKSLMLNERPLFPELFERAFGRREAEELYDIQKDPDCLNNLADVSACQPIRGKLREQLRQALKEQGDPRMTGRGDVFESYPRYSRMRQFRGFKKQGEYNTRFQ